VTNSPTDADLWAAAQRGDGRAFGQLFDRHQQRVQRVAFRLGFQRIDCEDLAAMAFEELWRKRRGVSLVDGSVYPWLAATVTNLARNLFRARERHRRMLREMNVATVMDAESLAIANIERDKRRGIVGAALAQLSDADRQLLQQIAIDETDPAVVARSLGINQGALRVRLHRARIRLSAAIGSRRSTDGTQ
jgi:RNA polymerase sigma factor (sigma-70 family)